MPELPEVRTVARILREKLIGKKVTGVKIIYAKTVEQNSLALDLLIGEKLKEINTYGKYLVFDFNKYLLISHLRMEGKYFVKEISEEIVKHEHVLINFDNLSLRYHDTRKFGRMCLIFPENLNKYEGLLKLAPEPFDSQITKEYLCEKLAKKVLPIKSILLDQTIMSGLGNIYADEVLFAAKISPLRQGKKITLSEAEKIILSSRDILNEAIKSGGTTIRSYTSSLGVTGNYQNYLKVHHRVNEPCLVCNQKIIKIKVGGRGTYYCPNCQK